MTDEEERQLFVKYAGERVEPLSVPAMIFIAFVAVVIVGLMVW
jgi:hypothetical protein